MKRTSKFIAALIIVFSLMLSILPIVAVAADEYTVYLVPNSNWTKDNARFAVYTWIEGGDHQWISMSDSNGDGIYEANIPAEYTNVIFCRMDPNKENGWSDNKTWNQTNNLEYDGINNMYTLADGVWSFGDGSWSVFDENVCAHSYGEDSICTKCGQELFYIVAGYVFKVNDEYYAEGDNTTLFGSKWDETDENNKMSYDPETGCYIKIYENVAKGKYAFKVTVNKSWDGSYGDNGENFLLEVEENGSTVMITLKDGNVTFASSVPMTPEQTPENPETPDETPDETPEAPEEPVAKLNFFQRIWLAILNFFKNLFS